MTTGEVTLDEKEVRALGRILVQVGAGPLAIIGGAPVVTISQKISAALDATNAAEASATPLPEGGGDE